MKPINSKISAGKAKVYSKNAVVYVIAIAIAAVAFFMMNQELNKYKKSVDVAVLKATSTGKIITKDEVVSRTIAYQDFIDGMILWTDVDKDLVGKYPTTDIWKDYPIMKEMVTDTPETKYEYLYTLPANEEMLTIKYDPNEAAGNIPAPGDRFRIRGTYSITDPTTGETTQTSDIIFNSATVVDMLNAAGDSVYQIMKDYNKLPPDKKKEVDATGETKNLVKPAAMMIAVPTQTMEKFSKFVAEDNVQFTYTLLTRDTQVKFIEMGNSIFDSIVTSMDETSSSGSTKK